MTRRRAWCWGMVLVLLAGCGGPYSSGDRVLVSKPYEAGVTDPRRFDVVVFKYPETPVVSGSARNYIKRLLGLPGEILAILFGQIFHLPAPPPGSPPYFDDLKGLTAAQQEIVAKRLWIKEPYWHSQDGQTGPNWSLSPQEKKILGDYNYESKDFTHASDPATQQWFQAGFDTGKGIVKFEPLRKPPDVMLAMRRIVFDNDFQPKDLKGKVPPRWNPKGTAWTLEDGNGFRHAGDPKQDDWLVYQHLLLPRRAPATRPLAVEPQLITNYMDYNGGPLMPDEQRERDDQQRKWVGHLMLECQVTVDEPTGELALVLSRGRYQFQARWKLETGVCTLRRREKGQEAWQELASKPSTLNKKGAFQVRFANFDSRLTVWVNGALPFDKGFDYDPPELPQAGEEKLTSEEFARALASRCEHGEWDLAEPAKVGSAGAAVQIHHLKLWRDTYYTVPSDKTMLTMYVQPKHYLVLGDNSAESSDSRTWGLVPDRLMLGRALLVYYPFGRAGFIR